MFKKYENNPVFGNKELGTTFDAYVTETDGKLRMDFSWRAKKSVAVCESTDGYNWSQPIITLGPDEKSGWEDDINRNCMLFVNDVYRMWYTGQARGHSYIGYAESDDGICFERKTKEPILISEYPYEKESVMNPCVLFIDGIYKMWYAAGETYEPNVLCYAESRDGIHFEKSRINPIFVKGTEKWEENRVGGCQVLKSEKYGYLMFYIGYRDVFTASVGVARSDNGITGWKRCTGNPLIVPDKDAWDADSCYKPTVVLDEKSNTFRLWYNGRCRDDEFIGLAEYTGVLPF